jgi:hypothetical protein
MNPLIVGGIFDLAGKVFDKLFPNPEEKAKAQLELFKLQQEGAFRELEANLLMAQGQMEINKAEAESPDFFRGGWRPFIGWVCGWGLAYQFLIRPILTFILMVSETKVQMLPSLELDTLMTLLFGLLGLGAMRTAEKLKGATK